ncbi:MAG TPA: type II toxin-antitoxin system PemK/MazF family toxin [Acidocella sp.]|nr:type II toxin-antitoxin system PemK/MazF family toxin [Acidocella sp.]
MKRGDLVTVALQGDFGKPRPALVIQADRFEEAATVTILPVTSTLIDAPLLRLTVEPSEVNGLWKRSQIMIDKASTVQRDKIGPAFGHLDDETMVSVTRSLAVFLGIA